MKYISYVAFCVGLMIGFFVSDKYIVNKPNIEEEETNNEGIIIDYFPPHFLLPSQNTGVNKKLVKDHIIQYIGHEREKYIDKVVDVAYKVSDYPILLISIMYVESHFNPNAHSSVGAFGLCQIYYDVWKDELKQFGIRNRKDLLDIEKNIRVGNYILTKLLKMYDYDVIKTLRHYSGNANRYPQKVLSVYGRMMFYASLKNSSNGNVCYTTITQTRKES
jgi:soluble lytic murein transglycosylase-like protein